ncbi:MAG: transcriptional regulator [Micrococcales bacterium 72-143]|nr:MAG: transcriptional regulator [Micrococcales bacterium 72-143]
MTSVLRDPDGTDAAFMTKRAWWLVGLNLLVPGSAQVLAGNRRLGRFGLGATLVLWLLVLVVLALALFARGLLLSLATNTWVLLVAVLVLVFYAVLWLVLTLDTLRLVRLVRVAPAARAFVAGLSVVALAAVSGTAAYGAVSATAGIDLLDSVFAEGPSQPPVDGRYNILLLGGDAGPDRQGLRPDSISVASVDAETGQVTLIGIPRNLERVPFSEGSPMWQVLPNGYDCGSKCLIDYLYTYGELDWAYLYPDAEKHNSSPGIEAIRDAVEGVLGISIPYYVLIDMQGFSDLIDAMGGIDITLEERVPYGANENPDGSHRSKPDGWIEAGEHHMDGYTALVYARTRYATSDYVRMQRQRQVQEAMIAQFTPGTVLTHFVDIAAAGKQVVRTDIPKQMLSYFVQLAEKTKQQPVVTHDLTPPEVDPASPDYDAIHATIHELLWPTATTAPPAG